MNALLLVLLGTGVLVFHFALKDFPTRRDVREEADRQDLMRKWMGKTAPDFELQLLDGTKFRLADAVGKQVIVINFFATWCGPCRGEMPEFIRFAKEHKDPGFLLLFIDAEEEEGKVRRFASTEIPGMPVGIDAYGDIIKDYDVKAFPTTVLIAPTGDVMVYQVGAVANAEVVFGHLVRSGVNKVKRESGALRENYLARLERERTSKSPTKELAGRALDFARKFRCPSCGKDLVRCRDLTGTKIRTRLRAMDMDALSDEAALKILFMEEAKP